MGIAFLFRAELDFTRERYRKRQRDICMCVCGMYEVHVEGGVVYVRYVCSMSVCVMCGVRVICVCGVCV